MKKFKFLTLTLLVLAICMTSVSATAALNPAGTYEDGVVTAVGKGHTYIHAEYNGQRATCKVFVK